MMGTQVLKLKFENFTYHKIKILTEGAYAPCMQTIMVSCDWLVDPGSWMASNRQM